MGGRGGVPVGRRQLAAEPAKLAVSLLAVAAAVALVLLLGGLRQGMGEQVTLYVDRQAPVVVGQAGSRNFLAQVSVLDEKLEWTLRRVPGVAAATPVSQQFAMLRLHGRRVLSLLVGYEPGRPGGPWRLAAGRSPRGPGEIALDRVLAGEHGLKLGSLLGYEGARLRVVGLTRGTSSFMTPLAFVTRTTANALARRPGTAGFFFVRPRPGVSAAALAARIERGVPGVAALTRGEVAANDRRLFVEPFAAPLRAMVAIAFAVAILVIGLTIYSSIVERGREYATLKAIGLRQRALFRLVGGQALVLAAGGTAAGVGLAIAAAAGISALAPEYLVAVDAGAVARVAAGALAMAPAAAFVPARHLARLDPGSALRR